MAVPAYTEDLTDIDLAESGSSGSAINYSGGGGGAPAFGADLGMQGAGAWDRQVSSHERAIVFNQTPGAGVVAAGVHIYQWLFVATPGITETLANRGAFIVIGTGTNATVQFHVEGNNTYGAAGRVGKCYPINYVTTSNTGSIPYRTLDGSPGATPTYFGGGMHTTASAKGSNLGVDAVRYGTGAYLTAGELTSAGDGSDDPCTFVGFQVENDLIANRWGILTFASGSYELQGAFVIGQNNAGSATLCRFQDSDRNIVIVDTVHTETTFSKFVIDHASTKCYWANINITALGTNNRGTVLVNNAATVFETTGGVWTDIGTVTLAAAAIIDGTTFRRTDLITLNGATITNALITSSRATASILATTLANITDNDFQSDGSNHAVELNSIGGGTMSWSGNSLANYDAGSAGSPVTPTSTGNEAIYVNVATASDLTINVAGGATVPSIRVGGSFTGSVNVVASTNVTISQLRENTEVRVMAAGTDTELDGIENAIVGSVDDRSFTFAISASTVVDIFIVNRTYENIEIYTYIVPSSDATLPQAQQFDRVYFNP